jgi:hypothetical protein
MFLDQVASHLAVFGFGNYRNIRRLFQKLADASSYDGVVIG